MTKKSESKVVEAAGSAAGGSEGLTPDVIQEAMAKAAAAAQAEDLQILKGLEIACFLLVNR